MPYTYIYSRLIAVKAAYPNPLVGEFAGKSCLLATSFDALFY
jgi:hypothetical protein